MKRTYTYVRETNGVNLTHKFSSIRTAIKSGRFDYLYDGDAEDRKKIALARKQKSVAEFISIIGYPFSVI